MLTRLALGGALALALFVVPLVAADQKTGFLTKTFMNADGTTSEYVLFVPHDYDGTKPYPVILFLHGAGETKGGKKMPVEVGIGPAIRKEEKTFPFITIIPQAEATKSAVRGRWSAGSPDAERALKMLDAVMTEYNTDSKRVYLTGLSMGGYGTWSLAAAYPEKWAAIVPICGGGDPAAAVKIKDIPTWVFHGDKDQAVPVERSREMIEAIKAAGGNPKYTEYPGVGHNSWDPAYATPELWTWLAEQKKK
jgi:predicted peptidase